MNDLVETILLKKAGDNRRRIDSLDSQLEKMKRQLTKMETKLNAAILLMEANSGEDREAYLKGEE